MKPRNPEKTNESNALERLVFFSDAVIAIALTLLVIEIKVPVIAPGDVKSTLTQQVLALWPEYLGYFTSFWVVALFWLSHHRYFQHIKRFNRRLIFLNFLFLMFVVFLPFPTALLFTYVGEPASVTFYAATVAAIGLAKLALWLYATHKHRLVEESLSPAAIRAETRNTLIIPAVFLTSIVIAQFNASAAMYFWIVLSPLSVILQRTE